jgi:hypothetical protein
LDIGVSPELRFGLMGAEFVGLGPLDFVSVLHDH